jgi:hypothetical protein
LPAATNSSAGALVMGQPLHLEIGSVGARRGGRVGRGQRPLVPIQTQPLQPVKNRLDRGLGGGGLVRVLDAKQESPPGVAGVEPIEQRPSGRRRYGGTPWGEGANRTRTVITSPWIGRARGRGTTRPPGASASNRTNRPATQKRRPGPTHHTHGNNGRQSSWARPDRPTTRPARERPAALLSRAPGRPAIAPRGSTRSIDRG